jgi:hypothetical protein
VCRWIIDEIKVDVMPTSATIIGFTNRWYGAAVRSAMRCALDDLEIRVVTAPYFVATKLEAFRSRGNDDLWSSHDIGDVIVLADGRPALVDEMRSVPQDVRQFVANVLHGLFEQMDLDEAIAAHLPPDEASQQRAGFVAERLRHMKGSDSSSIRSSLMRSRAPMTMIA